MNISSIAMSVFVALGFSLFSNSSYCQPVYIEKNEIREVHIVSNYGNLSNKKLIKNEYVDRLELNLQDNKWVIKNYTKTKSKNEIKKDTIIKKTKEMVEYVGKPVSYDLMDELACELTSPRDKTSYEDFGISLEDLKKATKKRKFLKVAKEQNVKYHFKRKYATRKYRKSVIEGANNPYKFDNFLKEHFSGTGYPLILNQWDDLDIFFYGYETTIRFEGKMPNLSRQPWYRWKTGNWEAPVTVLNPFINAQLLKILPKDFDGRELLGNERLFKAYIVWYLKEKGFIETKSEFTGL